MWLGGCAMLGLRSTMGECLENRRLQWFAHLERMEENAWLSRIRKFGAIILLKNDQEKCGVS